MQWLFDYFANFFTCFLNFSYLFHVFIKIIREFTHSYSAIKHILEKKPEFVRWIKRHNQKETEVGGGGRGVITLPVNPETWQ